MESKLKSDRKINLFSRYIKFAKDLKKKKNYTCEICNEKKKKTNEVVCHHVIPISKHYNYELIMDESIIQVLCHECHNIVHGTRGDTGEIIGGMHNVGSMRILKAMEKSFNGIKRK